MISRLARNNSNDVFRWEHLVNSQYRLFAGPTIYGGLSITPEPSILFGPAQGEFYRATAQAGDQKYSFKCLFKDGEFCGCVAVEEGRKQPVVLYEDHPAHSIWRSRSQIVLCEDGTECDWLHGAESGQWTVLGRAKRIIEMKSELPSHSGTLRVGHSSLMKRTDGPALILFSVYLAIGPKRQSAPASNAVSPQN